MARSNSTTIPMLLLVIGFVMNTIGIALIKAGPAAYALMGIGLLLLLSSVLMLVHGRPRDQPGETRQ